MAVANSFVQLLRALHEEQSRRGEKLDWMETHPLTKLYTQRLAELSGELTPAELEEIERSGTGA